MEEPRLILLNLLFNHHANQLTHNHNSMIAEVVTRQLITRQVLIVIQPCIDMLAHDD